MPLRVLLIQPEDLAASTLARLFKERGDQTWHASSCTSAFDLVEKVKPDLMVLDLHFPGKEWLTLLKQVQLQYPDIKIIVSNKYPDLQREMLAGEQGNVIFLRQPFSTRWVEQAVNRAFDRTAPQERGEFTRPILPRVRVPVRIKITLPYLVLALLFALGAAYVISQVVLESVQERYLNQLIETGKKTTNWMVRKEDDLLANLRLIANTQGAANAILGRDGDALRGIAYPLAVNGRLEAVDILDAKGTALFSARHRASGGAGEYDFSSGETFFQNQPFVLQTLLGKADPQGDKFSGYITAPWGDYFCVAGPVFDANNQLAGAVVVSQSLKGLAREAGQEVLAQVSLYNLNGKLLATTFDETQSMVGESLLNEVIQNQTSASHTRSLLALGQSYTEVLGVWEVRGGADLGLMGVALTENTLVRTSSVTQLEIFVLVALAIGLVIVVGLLVAGRITKPLVKLAEASSEVAQGNLEVKVPSSGNDEIAVLGYSFNHMIAGLQEGSVYRDLLGRTVSPEVREQLRQTFTTGGIKLEGQEAVATILMTDIRNFTTLSERADPTKVLNWLNEYFGQLVPIVTGSGGVVNKFDGDAMLAFFGILPRRLSPKNGAQAACQAAVAMIKAIDALNVQRIARGDPPLVTGIGVNTGVVIAGGLGTSDRLHYTIIGDAVNTAQRLEALTRQVYSTNGILVSGSTYQALAEYADQFAFEPAGQHQVKGKSEQLMVYRLEARERKPLGVML